MNNYKITETLDRQTAVEYITSKGADKAKALRMSDDSLATAYDAIKKQVVE